MQFSLKDLELFVAAAEAGSIARAAARCHTVPSAVSKRLSDLEDEFKSPLLVRGSKGVNLTPAGHALLARARGVLHQAAQLEEELHQFSSGVRGQVRVFANISSIVEFLPALLARFLAEYKDIRVHLEEHVSSVVAQAVADRSADVGIVSDVPSLEGLKLIPFRDDELVLVAQPHHPIAEKKRVHFVEALGYDFVALHSNSALHYRLLREAANAGRNLKVRIQVTSFDAVCAMVAAGLGVGIVPRAAATPYTSSLELVSLPLADAWARRKLHVCIRSREELSPAARQFVDHLTRRSAPGHRRAR
jgi:DNA-binding transcriptional LysR family regulator